MKKLFHFGIEEFNSSSQKFIYLQKDDFSKRANQIDNNESVDEGADWIKNQLDDLKDEVNIDKFENFSLDHAIKILNEVRGKTWSRKPPASPINSAKYCFALQAGLKMLGYDPGLIDGVFIGSDKTESNTKRALQAFQKNNMGGGNGWPGPRTIKKLIEKLEVKKAKTKQDSSRKPEKQKVNKEKLDGIKTVTSTINSYPSLDEIRGYGLGKLQRLKTNRLDKTEEYMQKKNLKESDIPNYAAHTNIKNTTEERIKILKDEQKEKLDNINIVVGRINNYPVSDQIGTLDIGKAEELQRKIKEVELFMGRNSLNQVDVQNYPTHENIKDLTNDRISHLEGIDEVVLEIGGKIDGLSYQNVFEDEDAIKAIRELIDSLPEGAEFNRNDRFNDYEQRLYSALAAEKTINDFLEDDIKKKNVLGFKDGIENARSLLGKTDGLLERIDGKSLRKLENLEKWLEKVLEDEEKDRLKALNDKAKSILLRGASGFEEVFGKREEGLFDVNDSLKVGLGGAVTPLSFALSNKNAEAVSWLKDNGVSEENLKANEKEIDSLLKKHVSFPEETETEIDTTQQEEEEPVAETAEELNIEPNIEETPSDTTESAVDPNDFVLTQGLSDKKEEASESIKDSLNKSNNSETVLTFNEKEYRINNYTEAEVEKAEKTDNELYIELRDAGLLDRTNESVRLKFDEEGELLFPVVYDGGFAREYKVILSKDRIILGIKGKNLSFSESKTLGSNGYELIPGMPIGVNGKTVHEINTLIEELPNVDDIKKTDNLEGIQKKTEKIRGIRGYKQLDKKRLLQQVKLGDVERKVRDLLSELEKDRQKIEKEKGEIMSGIESSVNALHREASDNREKILLYKKGVGVIENNFLKDEELSNGEIFSEKEKKEKFVGDMKTKYEEVKTWIKEAEKESLEKNRITKIIDDFNSTTELGYEGSDNLYYNATLGEEAVFVRRLIDSAGTPTYEVVDDLDSRSRDITSKDDLITKIEANISKTKAWQEKHTKKAMKQYRNKKVNGKANWKYIEDIIPNKKEREAFLNDIYEKNNNESPEGEALRELLKAKKAKEASDKLEAEKTQSVKDVEAILKNLDPEVFNSDTFEYTYEGNKLTKKYTLKIEGDVVNFYEGGKLKTDGNPLKPIPLQILIGRKDQAAKTIKRKARSIAISIK